MAAGRLRQLRLLLWKNWLFMIRSWKSTLLQLLAPCFFLVLVTLLSFLPQGLENVTDPPSVTIKHLPVCQGWNGKTCTTLMVFGADLSSPFNGLKHFNLNDNAKDCVNTLMDDFAKVSNLPYDQIERYLDNNWYTSNITKGLQNFKPNQTQAAILFTECNYNHSLGNIKLNYTIMYNATRALKIQQLVFGSPNKPDGRNEIQLALDQVFIARVLNKSRVNITVQTQTFPKLYQQESVEAKQAQGATVFLFCAITFQFVMMLYNVVSEKDLKLRQGLKLTGLKDSIYWVAWTITGFVIAFLSTCVLMASGYACQLKYFFNTNFIINFLLFFVYSASMVPLAFFASVFIGTIRMAVSVGMMVFVVGLIIITLLGNPFLLTQLYVYVKPLVYVLSFLPPFHLSKAMADIGLAASDTDSNGLPQIPYHYGWKQLFEERKVLVFDFNSTGATSSTHYLPETYISFVLLVANALFYGVLFWYLDMVMPGNHGIPRKLTFFLQPSYWFDGCKSQSRHRRLSAYSRPTAKDSDDEVTTEQDPLVIRPGDNNYGASNEPSSFEIDGLTKRFYSGVICRSPLPPAVDHLSLTVHEHQILALLGHNGAGKSTTINMLTGLLYPDEGDAFFYGASVTRNLDDIRSMLGVCPQHDILWNDLTAREHMELFAGMKGVPKHHVEREIFSLLEQVQLDHVADYRVGTFSGGMKRRLSVAMSFLGDPRVVFLDEPTTGMDPKIRRNIWNLILEKKANRVTIMTTHSMEEADILGDNIAIMANGQLRVLGTSVNLKNRFAGYNIELVVRGDSVQPIMDLVNTQLTGATLKSDPLEVEDGFLLLYNLPPDCQVDLIPFFKVLENESQISSLILDYSISQTTLEEVFINVTVNEVFRDKHYRPLLRSGSFSNSLTPSPPGANIK